MFSSHVSQPKCKPLERGWLKLIGCPNDCDRSTFDHCWFMVKHLSGRSAQVHRLRTGMMKKATTWPRRDMARHGATWRDARHATRDQTFTSFTLKLGYATVAVSNFNGFDVTAVPAPAKIRQIMESMPHVWTKSWKHHSMVLCACKMIPCWCHLFFCYTLAFAYVT